MPTLSQIEEANPSLSEAVQAHVASLIKSSTRYQENAALYSGLAAKIAAADGTVKGQQINAALALIDEIGDGTVKLTGGEKAVDYSQQRDREQLVSYIIDCLFDSVALASSTQVGAIVGSSLRCSRCGGFFGRFEGRCLCRCW